jgi:hypothetical protein
VDEVKSSKSDVGYNSNSELERGTQIIEVEPSATVSTTKLHPSEPDEPEEGERLFLFRDVGEGYPTTLHYL